MTDLAASIETLAAAYDQAEAAWRATPANTLHWDWLVEQKCRLADVTRGNLPAILAALRASRPEPAADAVEAAAVRVADATLCQWGKPNDCGREGAPCLCEAAATAVLSALAAAQEGSR